MDWSVVITGMIGILTTIVSALCSYIFTKRKYNVEVDGGQIENLKQIISAMGDHNKSQAEQISFLLDRNKALEAEIVEVRKQMFNFMQSICLDYTCIHRITERGKMKNIEPIPDGPVCVEQPEEHHKQRAHK